MNKELIQETIKSSPEVIARVRKVLKLQSKFFTDEDIVENTRLTSLWVWAELYVSLQKLKKQILKTISERIDKWKT